MKTFQNKQLTINAKQSAYSELLLACVNNTPQGGFTVEEMRARNRIVDAVETSKNGEISLEDADYAKALECVETMRWAVLDDQLVQFNDDFAAC